MPSLVAMTSKAQVGLTSGFEQGLKYAYLSPSTRPTQSRSLIFLQLLTIRPR